VPLLALALKMIALLLLLPLLLLLLLLPPLLLQRMTKALAYGERHVSAPRPEWMPSVTWLQSLNLLFGRRSRNFLCLLSCLSQLSMTRWLILRVFCVTFCSCRMPALLRGLLLRSR
jgi:hypothetical protein